MDPQPVNASKVSAIVMFRVIAFMRISVFVRCDAFNIASYACVHNRPIPNAM